LNPENVDVARGGPDDGYFVDEDLLSRVPNLLLILGGIYIAMGWTACLLITQPPEDWLDRQARQVQKQEGGKKEDRSRKEEGGKKEDRSMKEEGGKPEDASTQHKPSDDYVTPCEAFRRKELYLLWCTRLSVVMVSNVVSAFCKAFGQTFIKDDQFLAVVLAVNSVFNCTGRLLYGFIMDKTSYKVAMTIESTLLMLLVSTFYLTSIIGVDSSCAVDVANNITAPLISTVGPVFNSTVQLEDYCDAPTTLTTKIVYAMWVWAIYFTFPGTYSTQPAVTTQTFGHKYGGFIYAFLFSSDIVNNLLVATMSKAIKDAFGWLGLFLTVSSFGSIALVATMLYPYRPSPGARPNRVYCAYPLLARLGLVEIPKQVEVNGYQMSER